MSHATPTITGEVGGGSRKSAAAAYLLWFFLGAFGAHRFYMGRTGSGLGMLGLCLGSMLLSVFVIGLIGLPILAVWWLVDAFLIPRWMMDGLAAMPMPGGDAESVSRAA